MSQFPHSICEDCFIFIDDKTIKYKPSNLGGAKRKCCFCGKEHNSGLYIRNELPNMICTGDHLD
jgi:hypothetical protein